MQSLWAKPAAFKAVIAIIVAAISFSAFPCLPDVSLPEGSSGLESFLCHPSSLALDMRNSWDGTLLTKLAVFSMALPNTVTASHL